MWNFVSVFGISNNRTRFWSAEGSTPDLQLWQFRLKWNACFTTHFSCHEQFFSHLKWDFKSYTLSKAGKKKIPKRVSDHYTAFNQPIFLCQLIPVSYTCSLLLLPKGQLEYAVRQQLFITLLQVSPHASSLPFPTSPFLSPCSNNRRGSICPLYCFSADWEALQVSRSC